MDSDHCATSGLVINHNNICVGPEPDVLLDICVKHDADYVKRIWE